MTTPPTDSLLATFRREYQEIAAALDAEPGGGPREEARQRIVALFRQVEGTLVELTAFKEEIRALVARYKAAGVEGRTRLHSDHLGASTFIERGWSLLAQGDHAGAVAALNRALELSPGESQALSLLGWAQVQAESYDEALATFSRVLATAPSNALARVNVGFICLKKRIFGEAIEHLSRAIRLDNDPKAILYAHYYLGLVYLERGMLDDAEACLGRALELGPNLVEAWYDLGRIRWFAGRREAARESWARGVSAGRFSPWGERCQEVLDRTARGEEVPRFSSP